MRYRRLMLDANITDYATLELKTGKATHQDLGQLQMYVNYYDRYEKSADENPTIGILLCAEKNDTLVKMSLPQNNNAIVAAKYQLYLPSEQQLIDEVEKVKFQLSSQTEEDL